MLFISNIRHTNFFVFIYAIWLPNNQLWATMEGTALLIRFSTLDFDTESRINGHQEPRSKVGTLSLAEHLLGFEP